jgi:spore maturation protein CgeB
MRILYAGELAPHTRCAQRARTLRSMGHRLLPLSLLPERLDGKPAALSLSARLAHRLGYPLDQVGLNRSLLAAVEQQEFDLLWIENGRSLQPGVLSAVRRLRPTLPQVLLSEDDLFLRHNRSRFLDRTLPEFDLVVTTKRRHVDQGELARLGARYCHYEPKSFDPELFHPLALSSAEQAAFGAPLCFVGTYEEPRFEACLALARAGLPVRVFGNGWERARAEHPNLRLERRPLVGRDYVRAIAASDLSLGFLRRANRDEHTDRSVEIPAAGGVLLAERSAEHLELFPEGQAALYFGDTGELIQTARRALADPRLRHTLAWAGRQRCLELNLTHLGACQRILAALASRCAHSAAPQASRPNGQPSDRAARPSEAGAVAATGAATDLGCPGEARMSNCPAELFMVPAPLPTIAPAQAVTSSN